MHSQACAFEILPQKSFRHFNMCFIRNLLGRFTIFHNATMIVSKLVTNFKIKETVFLCFDAVISVKPEMREIRNYRFQT